MLQDLNPGELRWKSYGIANQYALMKRLQGLVLVNEYLRRTSQPYPRKTERPKVPRFMQKNGHCNIRQAAQVHSIHCYCLGE